MHPKPHTSFWDLFPDRIHSSPEGIIHSKSEGQTPNEKRRQRIAQWHEHARKKTATESYLNGFRSNVDVLSRSDVEDLRKEPLSGRFPAFLLAQGNLSLLTRPLVAIIGSRTPTLYGRRMAAHFGSALAREGVTVLSGGALGIDAIANKAALQEGSTCAIVGGGLFCAHPRTHHALFDAMVRSGRGLVMSQFPEDEGARPWHFPCRNITIAELADFVLVIEASPKSGSLITAEAALEAGKDLGALPGEVENPLALGTNALISNGAFCIQHPADVLERVATSRHLRQSRAALLCEAAD